jgi:hypothetical protein
MVLPPHPSIQAKNNSWSHHFIGLPIDHHTPAKLTMWICIYTCCMSCTVYPCSQHAHSVTDSLPTHHLQFSHCSTAHGVHMQNRIVCRHTVTSCAGFTGVSIKSTFICCFQSQPGPSRSPSKLSQYYPSTMLPPPPPPPMARPVAIIRSTGEKF